jgi:phosphoribosyl-ATP pyrophosphohydrolase/phosphoribosyl-AMP cyclohydrolase
MSIDELTFGSDGLLPVVIQDSESGRVLTLAYANREALERTLAERSTWLYSRSRRALWNKGATSGNTQRVVGVSADCDGDALLYRVEPAGPACHTGAASCFERSLAGDPEPPERPFERAVRHLETTIESRRTADPERSYVAKLLRGGVDRICKKIGEEATEVVIAAKNAAPEELKWESADLVFHLLVLLAERGVTLDDVGEELLRRAK